MTPADLISIYNRVIEPRGLKRYPHISKAMGHAIREFLTWCEVRSVDPERWIRARHEAQGFRRRIRFGQLRSEKFLPKFREWGDQHQAGQAMQHRLSKQAIDGGYSRYGYLAETIKRSTVPEVCIHDAMTIYSSESKTCGSCRLRVQCAGC